jgi:hypothetical protein
VNSLSASRDGHLHRRHGRHSCVLQSTLPVSYWDNSPNSLDHRPQESWFAIKVSRSSALLFVKADRCMQTHRPVEYFGGLNRWVDTARHLGMTLDKHQTSSTHKSDRATQRLGMISPLLNRTNNLSIRNAALFYQQPVRPMGSVGNKQIHVYL